MALRLFVLALASVGPLIFPLAQSGYGTLHQLAIVALLPSLGALAAVFFLARRSGRPIAREIIVGVVAGLVGTVGLEAVRYTGFSLGFMPGNLPQLMGVLLLDRFALGPSGWSDLAGFAYHFWNGAAFGVILLVLTRSAAVRLAVPYGLAVGLGFLGSPVVESLGVGFFGRDFGWPFAATVLTAHAAFGGLMGLTMSMLTSPDRHPGPGFVTWLTAHR